MTMIRSSSELPNDDVPAGGWAVIIIHQRMHPEVFFGFGTSEEATEHIRDYVYRMAFHPKAVHVVYLDQATKISVDYGVDTVHTDL